MLAIEAILGRALDLALERLGMDPPPGTLIEPSRRQDLGDYASPVALSLARPARQPPMNIATQLARELAGSAYVESASASPPGFVNIRLSSDFFDDLLHAVLTDGGAFAHTDLGQARKVVIEHTNVNPNKAAHVGHLRNACLGDTLARILSRLNWRVEVQNYIDDTGAQVADVVVGLRELGLEPHDGQPYDQFLSDVYVAVQRAYELRPELRQQRAVVQHAMERPSGELATFSRQVAERAVRANLSTMARCMIHYDLLTWESHVLAHGFWKHTFEVLRERQAIRYVTHGPNAGCWVLPFGLGTVQTADGTVAEDKILVTSHGLATYTAKDIAYQMWKFGLLGRDFAYDLWGQQSNGRAVWTTVTEGGRGDAPLFGRADAVVNVIDVRQSYLQQVVYDSLRRLGYATEADSSHHLAYEMVVLSAAAATELGIDTDTAIAMSGRQGLQVYADDLLDRLTERLARKSPADIARQVAAGAARYYMLKFSANQVIEFDFDEALRTTGESGVYLQYTLVRARSILRKLDASPTGSLVHPLPVQDRALLLRLAQFPRALHRAGTEWAPVVLAKYAFELATAFNTFYDNTTPIVRELDEGLRWSRGALVRAFVLAFEDVLDALGIPYVDRI
jgi:arginyl-tRNA synthetase